MNEQLFRNMSHPFHYLVTHTQAQLPCYFNLNTHTHTHKREREREREGGREREREREREGGGGGDIKKNTREISFPHLFKVRTFRFEKVRLIFPNILQQCPLHHERHDDQGLLSIKCHPHKWHDIWVVEREHCEPLFDQLFPALICRQC